MNEPEIILNLWYIHDDAGFIYSLRARAYIGVGSDEEKMAMLERFANIDYLIARPFRVPERFHTDMERDGERARVPVMHSSLLNSFDSPLVVYEEAIQALEAELPAQTNLRIPHDPIMCSTALLADNSGKLYSGRRKVQLSRSENSLEVGEPTWTLILSFMAKRGWEPPFSVSEYLAKDVAVSAASARAFAQTAQHFFTQALQDPAAYQLNFDVEQLAKIADFASDGRFVVSRME